MKTRSGRRSAWPSSPRCPVRLRPFAQEQPAPAPQAAAEPGRGRRTRGNRGHRAEAPAVPAGRSAVRVRLHRHMLKEGRMPTSAAIVDFTPGFSGNTEDGFTDALAMRGIATNDFGIGGDPSVAMFVDGIWSGRTGGVMTSITTSKASRSSRARRALCLAATRSPAPSASSPTSPTRRSGQRGADARRLRARRGARHGQRAANESGLTRGRLRAGRQVSWRTSQGGDDLGFHEVSSGRVSLRYAGDSFDATLIAAYEDREQDPSVYWVPADGLTRTRSTSTSATTASTSPRS